MLAYDFRNLAVWGAYRASNAAADVVVESNGADEVPIKKNEMDAGKSSRPVLAHQDKKKGKQKKKRLQPNGTSKDGFARGNSGT